MPPEYIQHGQFDERGDLFALGVLMFELLTGERPFEGASELDTLRRIVAGDRRALPPDVPPALSHCIDRALAVDPRARFDSARTLLEALPAVAVARTRRRLSDIVRALAPSPSTPRLGAASQGRAPHASASPQQGPTAALAGRPSSRPPSPSAPAELASSLAPTLYAPPSLEPTRTTLRTGRPSRAAVLTLLAAATLLGSVAGLVLLRLEPKSAAAPPALPPVQPVQPAQTLQPVRPSPEPPAPMANEAPPPPRVPEAPPALVSTDVPRTERTREKRRTRTEPRAASDSSAELKVVVVPFGEVWIDDKYIGASPVSVRLAPGAHVVGVGEGRARERRTVHLADGAHEQLVFRPDADKAR
jgi:eukaryotic-like serine/threonine-protein kinase